VVKNKIDFLKRFLTFLVPLFNTLSWFYISFPKPWKGGGGLYSGCKHLQLKLILHSSWWWWQKWIIKKQAFYHLLFVNAEHITYTLPT